MGLKHQTFFYSLHHIIHLPGLTEAVVLAAAVNLVIGVTLTTSAAMMTGVHGATDTSCAFLQMAGRSPP